MSVVKGLDSQANLIYQKPEFASSLAKTLEPANLPNVVSTAGRGWFSRLTNSFSLVKSTHTLILPLLFGVTTIGEHQSVGWSTGEMSPVSSILSSSSFVFRYNGRGTFLGTEIANGLHLLWVWWCTSPSFDRDRWIAEGVCLLFVSYNHRCWQRQLC